jgi:ubiquinone/menaquinone biosynthesis C-methylase UbiE
VSEERAHTIRGFEEIDGLDEQAAFFVRFLDTFDTFDAIRAYRNRTIDRFVQAQSRNCLDIGCGTGTFAIEFAKRAHSATSITGVDISNTMIEVASRRASREGVDVTFTPADARNLPFEDASFDATRVERVFMYLEDVHHAASELVRVTKPGGLVVATDTDLETSFWDAPGIDPSVVRRFITSACDGVPNGRIGSELPRIMKQAGLIDIDIRTDVATIADPEVGMDRIGNRQFINRLVQTDVLTAGEAADLIGLSDSDDYFAGFTYFTVTGRVA